MVNKNSILKQLLIIVIIFSFISLITSIKSLSYNEYDNLIVNRTNQDYLEKITYLGLNLLQIEGIRIIISEIPKGYEGPNDVNGNVQGFIRHYYGDYYGIYINKEDFDQSIKILSHELIHLYQYRSKKLVNTNNYYVWKNDTLYKPINYHEKPWEIEAFEVGEFLEYGIKKFIIE